MYEAKIEIVVGHIKLAFYFASIRFARKLRSLHCAIVVYSDGRNAYMAVYMYIIYKVLKLLKQIGCYYNRVYNKRDDRCPFNYIILLKLGVLKILYNTLYGSME